MYVIKDYKQKIRISVKRKSDIDSTLSGMILMFGCHKDDIKILNEKDGTEKSIDEFYKK